MNQFEIQRDKYTKQWLTSNYKKKDNKDGNLQML